MSDDEQERHNKMGEARKNQAVIEARSRLSKPYYSKIQARLMMESVAIVVEAKVKETGDISPEEVTKIIQTIVELHETARELGEQATKLREDKDGSKE